MPNALQITTRLSIIPLLDIHQPDFEKFYRDGIWWSLFKEHHNNPITDRYVVENVRSSLAEASADGQQMIGFHFGRLHGAILSPKTGELRPNVTVLAHFQDKQAARGYNVGREWYFIDAQPDERTYTDSSLLERLQNLMRDSIAFHDEDDTWCYSLGCILGELSGQIIPATSQEYVQWEAVNRKWIAEYEQSARQESDTEPLPISVVEYID